jgi:nitric oxide reductase subunit C
MQKLLIFLVLFVAYIIYSVIVYTSGTEGLVSNEKAAEGKLVFQKYNCSACHQLYGLGGYLGPDLTTLMSTKGKGGMYAMAILKTGTQRMPDFHLKDSEIDALVEFLKYVDRTAITYKNKI